MSFFKRQHDNDFCLRIYSNSDEKIFYVSREFIIHSNVQFWIKCTISIFSFAKHSTFRDTLSFIIFFVNFTWPAILECYWWYLQKWLFEIHISLKIYFSYRSLYKSTMHNIFLVVPLHGFFLSRTSWWYIIVYCC